MNNLLILSGNWFEDTNKINDGLDQLKADVEKLQKTAIYRQILRQGKTVCFVDDELYNTTKIKLSNLLEAIILMELRTFEDIAYENNMIETNNKQILKEINSIDEQIRQKLAKSTGNTINWNWAMNQEDSINRANHILDDVSDRKQAMVKKGKQNIIHWKNKILEKYKMETGERNQLNALENLRDQNSMEIKYNIAQLERRKKLHEVLPSIKMALNQASLNHDAKMNKLLGQYQQLQTDQENTDLDIIEWQQKLADSKQKKKQMEKSIQHLTEQIQIQMKMKKNLKTEYNKLKKELN